MAFSSSGKEEILPQSRSATERLIRGISAPLDHLRLWVFRKLSPWIIPLIRDRSLRVCLTASVFFILAFFFAISAPLWQLLLGPIIWGIPHLIGDLRYLVLREGLERQLWFWILVCIPFVVFLWSYEPYFAMLGVVFSAFFSKRASWGKVGIIILSLFFLTLSWLDSRSFLFGFLHLHNLIGIGIWWFWRKNRAIWEAIPLLLCFLGSIYLLTQAPMSMATELFPARLDAEYFAYNLADFAEGEWRFRWVSLYAFLQSAHYIVWVRLIPEEARKQYTPRSFQKSLRALRDDFGSWIFWGTAIAMIGLLVWAFFDGQQARSSYLHLIAFHGFLELAVLAYVGVPR